MDRDTEIFVQGFWVRCREIVRPELDHTIEGLKAHGHDAHVATQEYSAVADGLPEPGPSLILSVHPNHASRAATLQFRGDVAKADVIVEASNGTSHRHPLHTLELSVVKAEISTFLTDLLGPQR
jgi:hypothetical protein